MKLLSLLLILFISINFINAQCTDKCKNEDEVCITSGINYTPCGQGLGCAPFNSTRYTCQKFISEGEYCSKFGLNSDNCDVGLSCLNGNNREEEEYTCQPSNYLQVNQVCDFNYQCTGSLQCIDNKCQLRGGSKCDSDSDCDYNEYCYTRNDANLCQKIKMENDLCDSRISKDCFYGLNCITNSSSYFGKCQYQSKKELGAKCNYMSKYQECDTSEDLYCSENSRICEKLVLPEETKNCTMKSCGFQTCSCDGKCYQTSAYPTQEDTLQENLRKCALDNGCVFVNNMITSKSCIGRHCRSDICENAKVYYPNRPESCSNEHYVNSICSSSTKIMISLFSILLLLSIHVL